MVEGKTLYALVALTFAGGFYVAAVQSGKRMCESDYSTRLTSFQSGCSTGKVPDTFDLVKYYIGI